jgi:FAD/FMN-containing dehydrogenase
MLIVRPEDDGWDQARLAWDLSVDQHPAAVAFPESAADVVAAVELAREEGLRVAAQGTGHGAGPLGPLADTLVVKTERMRGVEVDADAGIARVEAGVISRELAEAAAAHGLAPLGGSAPDVGVVGYTLGGGLGWLGRKHGLATNNVEAAELVTADGQLVRANDQNERDLFWALRGGGGNFGVVTALEVRLVPLAEAYAGILWWPIERGGEVLQTWRELTEGVVPDELTTVGRFLRVPPFPEVPEEIRGKSFVVVEAIHLGDPAEADALLAPLRDLGPAMDTMQTIPAQALGQVHMDPEQPTPGAGDGLVLSALPPEAVDELVRAAGADSDSELISVEVRQLGGAFARSNPDDGALTSIDAEFLLFAVGMAASPEQASATAAQVDAVQEALASWAAPYMTMNFAGRRTDPRTLWRQEVYDRLRAVKERVDPSGMIRANCPLIADA